MHFENILCSKRREEQFVSLLLGAWGVQNLDRTTVRRKDKRRTVGKHDDGRLRVSLPFSRTSRSNPISQIGMINSTMELISERKRLAEQQQARMQLLLSRLQATFPSTGNDEGDRTIPAELPTQTLILEQETIETALPDIYTTSRTELLAQILSMDSVKASTLVPIDVSLVQKPAIGGDCTS